MICDHALTEYCECIGPRRPPVYVRPHVEMRGPGERLPGFRCRCMRPSRIQGDGWVMLEPLLRNKRHASEADCIPLAEVVAFQRAHPEIKTLSNARRMLWLNRTFAPIPEREIPF